MGGGGGLEDSVKRGAHAQRLQEMHGREGVTPKRANGA